MNIAIFPNTNKSKAMEMAGLIRGYLVERGVSIFAEDNVAETLNAAPLSQVAHASIDFLVTIGGDGTILRAIHHHPDLQAPVLAINFGGLGFMADITVEELYLSLENLLEGHFQVQQRLVIDGITARGDSCFAVNEIVVHRAMNPCLIDIAIYVDDQYLNTFSSDGLIISTATGSTAYSMAAGGPILSPELEALVITPICPHTISNKPIVLMPSKEIRLQYLSEHEPVEIIYDGFPKYMLARGEEVAIRRSLRIFQLVSMLHHDFFSTLRSKLGWTGKLKAEM